MLLFSTCILTVSAQKNKGDAPTKNISGFLDNGRAKNSLQMIKFRVAPALSGYFGLSYENRLTKKISLEAGLSARILGKNAFFEQLRLNETYPVEIEDIMSCKGGMGFLLFPKLQFGRKYLNRTSYIGIRYTYNTTKVDHIYGEFDTKEAVNMTAMHTYFMYGQHSNIFSHITLGTELGFGLSIDKYKNISTLDYIDYTYKKRDVQMSSLLVMFDVTLGYLF